MAHYSKFIFVYGNWKSIDVQSKEMDKLAEMTGGKHTGGMRGFYGTIDYKTKAEAEAAVMTIDALKKYTAMSAWDRNVTVNQQNYDRLYKESGFEAAEKFAELVIRTSYKGIGLMIKRQKA